jgi:hypothetical protein
VVDATEIPFRATVQRRHSTLFAAVPESANGTSRQFAPLPNLGR